MATKTKKAKLSTASIGPSEEDNGPVAGPSSERLDHAQKVDMRAETASNNEETDDSDAHDGSDDEDDEDEDDLSGVSEGSDSGQEDDEEDDYEDILQANEDAQAGKKKSKSVP